MGFLDDLKKNLDVVVDVAEQTAKKTYNKAKIDFKIRALNKEIADLAHEMGMLTYTSYKQNQTVSEAKIQRICAQIDENKDKIYTLEKHKDAYKTSYESPQNAPYEQGSNSRYASLNRHE